MGNWNDLHDEFQKAGSQFDIIRRKYILELSQKTGRNVIAYYSGWLQKPGVGGIEINDSDKTGFMTTIHKLDKSKGLDLVLHTPGGDAAATESIVEYLRSIFQDDIRAIVPEIAMSAGTMIACASKVILMGKHSSLGPIDPQMFGVPAHGIIEEFETAVNECSSDPTKIPMWREIIAKYNPTLMGECQKAIDLSRQMVGEWLKTGMFKDDSDSDQKIDVVLKELADHAVTKSHGRHIGPAKCIELGLKIQPLEDEPELQNVILSTHHSYIHTLSQSPAVKIIENHEGKAYIRRVNAQT